MRPNRMKALIQGAGAGCFSSDHLIWRDRRISGRSEGAAGRAGDQRDIAADP
jgi:hypothetical protein